MSYSSNGFAHPIYRPPASFLQEPARYCEENNINWTSNYNLAADIAKILVLGPLSAVYDRGEDAATAVTTNIGVAISSINNTMAKEGGSMSNLVMGFGSWAAKSVYGMLWSTGDGAAEKTAADIPETCTSWDGEITCEAETPLQDLPGSSHDFGQADISLDWLLVGVSEACVKASA